MGYVVLLIYLILAVGFIFTSLFFRLRVKWSLQYSAFMFAQQKTRTISDSGFLFSHTVFKKLNVVSGRCGVAAAAGPVGVEEFTAWFVGAFVGVRAEVIALGLQQVGGQARGAIAIEVGEG